MKETLTRRCFLKAIAAASCAVFSLVLCRAAWGQIGSEVRLEGRVLTNQGVVIPTGVRVELTTTSGMEVSFQFANSNGEFDFPNLPKTAYNVTVTARGFQTYQQTVDLHETGDTYNLNIYLNPAGQQAPNPAAPSSRTDRDAPKQARKEEEKGAKALTKHKYATARAHFEKAVGIYPCYARAQAGLALVLDQERNLEGAETALRKGIQCDPDFLGAYVELAEILGAEKKFGDEEGVLQQGIRRSPSAWALYYEMGLAQFAEGKLAAAEADFLKVKVFNPSPPPEFYVRLSDLYVKEQAFPKAYDAMEGYLRAAPRGRFAARVRTVMRQMVAAGVVKPQPPAGAQAKN